ncbi:MAG: VanZ family protein [Peptoniphilus sp.]|nr:VanZ family protein [Peptoniphilus sp.]
MSFFLTRGIIAFLITFVVFSLVRTNFFKKLKRKSSAKREFLMSIFVGYMALISLFLFIPNIYLANKGVDLTSENFDFVGDFKDRIIQGGWGVNLIPFKTISSYIKYSRAFHAALNILGNMLIFVPMGFMLPLLYDDLRSYKKTLAFTVIICILVETIQFFVGRSVDIDDLILNVAGASMGYLLYKWKGKLFLT